MIHYYYYFLIKRSLFSDNPTLHNINTGITADDIASNAKTVNNMVMKMYYVIFLLEKNYIYIISIASNNCIKISDKIINIDPQLVFQSGGDL